MVFAALVFAALSAAGCGSAADDRTVVRFWAFGREGEWVKELVPDFEARHPGIRIEVQQIPWTAAHEKLLTAYVGNATPDAAQLGTTWIAEFVALDALEPLDERLTHPAEGVRMEDYFAGIWQSNVVGGRTWGIPWYVDTRVLFYRTDLFSPELWPPRDWADWRRAMEGVTDSAAGGQSRDERFALLLPIDEWAQPVIFALQTGSRLLREGGSYGAFTDPEFRKAMAFYTDLFRAGLAPPLDQTGLSNLYQQFADGTYASVITGPWNLTEFRSRLPAELQNRWSTAPLPPPEATMDYPGVSLAGGTSLVLFRHSDPSENNAAMAAWEWVQYLSEPAQQARFYRLAGALPPALAAWRLTGLSEDPQAAAFLRQLRTAKPTPVVPEWERIAARVAECAEQIVRGGRDLDEALEALNQDVDRLLEKRRFLLKRAGDRGRNG